MELGTFAPRPREDMVGDQLQAKEAIDKPLIVFVREHKTGIKTKFNQDAANAKTYKPEGADGVTVDAADVSTDEVWIDVLWLNGAIVDNLVPYVGQAVPIKLAWQAPANGGNSYIVVTPLIDGQLAQAQAWAGKNATRFDTERAQRAANAASFEPAQPVTPLATVPMASTAAPAVAAAPVPALPMDPNDPAIAALLAQLAAQQAQPAAS